jgi:DNA-binding transcriptional LysR family regulator
LTATIAGADGSPVYDPVTLDQLRAFVAVVEEGSFSAAARKLKRVQSAISTSMGNLESQLGVTIWDRSTKVPKLTAQGQTVLGAARRVLMEVDGLRRLTAGMVMGLEAQVSICLDALFPVDGLVDLCTAFTKAFPAVDLRIDTQVMSAVSARVLDGTATLGIVSPGGPTAGLERHALAAVTLIPVVGPGHPLAALRGPIAKEHFSDAIQIVLTERIEAGIADRAVLSPRTWRVADLHTKHMLLRAGLGWGNLPEHVARDDLRSGKLVAIRPEEWGEREHTVYLSAIYRTDAMFGPAHRWLLAQLPLLCARDTGAAPVTARKPKLAGRGSKR